MKKHLLSAFAAAALSHAFAQDLLGDLNTRPWIGDGREAPVDEALFYSPRPASEFRAFFVCPKDAKKLSVCIVAAGYYTFKVNGAYPDEAAGISLMPLWSPFNKTVYADRYELDAAILKPWPATNELNVAVGNGFYNIPPLRFWGSKNFRKELSHGEPVFKLALEGVQMSSWQCRQTSVTHNCVYLGARHDATSENTSWKPAVVAKGPSGKIVLRQAPPIGVYKSLCGKSKWLKPGHVQVVDFGENATGVPVFRFRGKRGQEIEILYGERLNADGTVNVLTQTAGQIKRPGMGGRGAPDVAAQRDRFVCSGNAGGDVFRPLFTYHICRYAEIRGLDTLLHDGDVKFDLVSSLVKDASPGVDFVSDCDEINRIHEMCRRTFRSNLVGVQSDCPGRERLGYGGDIVATFEAMMLNYDMREFYLKTLQDFADEASDDGWITETAPYVGVHDCGFGGRSGPVSWALCVPELIDGLLRHYDEKRALDYYPVCARYVRLLSARFPDGIIPHCIGDHEALERAPNNVTATAHWHRFVELTASFARKLALLDDAKEFEMLAQCIKSAFVRSFVDSEGVVANGSQSAQAIALHLGLVPEEMRAKVLNKLIEAVEKKNYAPHTGIFSTRYMLLALSENGRVDIARKIVLHNGFPGYLHMLERGATTLWETWKESANVFSNCHPMFGSVDEWILKYIKPKD